MTKQRRTFGCIQRIRKDAYRLRWTEHGERKSKMVYGTRVEANKQLAEIQTSFNHGVVTPQKVKIAKLYETRYLPEAERKLAAKTLTDYKCVWQKYIDPHWGKYEPREVKAGDVQEWILTLPQNSAVRALNILRSVMRQAVLLELIDHSPLEFKFEMPKTQTKSFSKDIIQSEDITLYIEAVKGTILEAPFIFGACGGLRPGEMLGVKIGEVEKQTIKIGDNTISVALVPVLREIDDYGRVVQNNDGTERLKTKHSQRWSVIQEPYASMLFALQKAGQKNGDTFFADDGFGRAIGKTAIRTEWHRITSAHHLKRIDLRNLRPSFATNMHYDYALPSEDIAKLMGHTKPTITWNTYERPDKTQLGKILAKSRVS